MCVSTVTLSCLLSSLLFLLSLLLLSLTSALLSSSSRIVFIIVFHYALSVFTCQKSPHLDESRIDVVQLNSHWVSSAVVNHYGDGDAPARAESSSHNHAHWLPGRREERERDPEAVGTRAVDLDTYERPAAWEWPSHHTFDYVCQLLPDGLNKSQSVSLVAF